MCFTALQEGSGASAAQQRGWGEVSEDLTPITWLAVQCSCPSCPLAFWLAAVRRNSPAGSVPLSPPPGWCSPSSAPLRSLQDLQRDVGSQPRQATWTATACSLGGKGGASRTPSQLVLRGPLLSEPGGSVSRATPCTKSQALFPPLERVH